MRKCSKCGREVTDETVKFCPKCGNRIDEPEQDGDLKDERCECGNLLCKISPETVEIKCRRCKRIHIVPIDKLV